MKIDLKKVLVASEHSGLFMFISDSKSGVIVESLADKKRTCISPRTKITSLSDIAVYTDSGELRLKEVLERIKNFSAEKELPDPKTDVALLKKYFQEVIPEYDRDRFYGSHMKKVVEWFRLLRDSDALDFEEEAKPEEKAEDKDESPVAQA